MPLRFHARGRWRAWLGARLGGDAELGDRAWRRVLHAFGAAVLLYFLLPRWFFVVLPTDAVLLLGLELVLVLEALRLFAGAELPTIREYERARMASYVYYAIALVAAVLLFPFPVASVVVLGTAWVDPLVGELRLSARGLRWYPVLPGVVYVGLGVAVLVFAAHWTLLPAVGLSAVAAAVALAVERPKIPELDDDLAMTLVPALVAELLLLAVPGIFP